MELFLLFVVILLLIIFNSSKSSRLKVLEQKLSHIENYLKNIQLGQQAAPAAKPATTETARTVAPPVIPTVVPPVVPPPPPSEKTPVIVPEAVIPPVRETIIPPKPRPIPSPAIQPPVVKPVVPQEDWYDRFRKNNPDLEKFIGENLLSKIAIVVLVIGIAFFVKYAIDKDWINEVARVGIGILCGGIVLGFAHRLHRKFKAFSSVLVAGGISIFYFTIGIAFHQYHIFDQTTAFIIMLFITGFSVFISVAYDRVELAALSLVGGFATPFIASNGGGNYHILFIYILILDLGMLVLAYLRKWPLINILAYGFTMLLYLSWLETRVIDQAGAPYSGALVFGAIFYVVFVLMNVVNNLREKKKFGRIELSILISNTFLFYMAGMQILAAYHPELKGLFSLFMALFNLVCSWFLYKKFSADTRLVYLMIGLTLTFITLIAPVQLQGNYITIFWALESVLLMWLAQRSGIVIYRFASVVIAFLMFMSLMLDWIAVYMTYGNEAAPVIFNKGCVTGIIAALSLLATALLLRKETEKPSYLGITFHPVNYSRVLKSGFIGLLYFTGFFELCYQLQVWMPDALAIYILVMSYHLLFVTVLNLGLAKTMSSKIKKSLYMVNFISSVGFVLCFAMLPLADFTENLISLHGSSAGFIFHYVSIACTVFLAYRMRTVLHESASPVKNNMPLNTFLVAGSIIYLCSIELLLHVARFSIHPVTDLSGTTVISKLDEYGISRMHVIKIGFPVLWGLLAFAFLFIGMKKQNKPLRIIALALIALTLLKLFTYDIQNASEAGKIIAFIILGVVLLIISFMYQKIKALLIDDAAKTEREEKTQTPTD